MKLDISHIPAEKTSLSWVSMFFSDEGYAGIIISEEQAKEVFCGSDGQPWDYYRAVPIYVAVTPKRLQKSK